MATMKPKDAVKLGRGIKEDDGPNCKCKVCRTPDNKLDKLNNYFSSKRFVSWKSKEWEGQP